MHLVWKQAGMQESPGLVRQNATGPLPVSHFQTWLRSSMDGPDHTVQSQPGSNLDLAKWIQSGSKLVCIIMPGLAECNQHACYQFPTFRLGCILPQMTWIILCKASLDPVWYWLHASGLEASQCARIIRPGSGRMQPAHYQFSTFRLGCVLPQTAWVILCKASLDPIWFWLTVSSFGQMDLVWKQAGVQESPVNTSSNQCFQADLDQMQFRSGMFAGDIRRT